MKPPCKRTRASLEARLFLPLLFSAAASMVTAQSSGPFTATGSMTTSRWGHSATLLADGRVLIAGGEGGAWPFSLRASAELYDPSSGTFAPTGNMTKPRSGHTATLLPDGRVLIAGATSAELYDPVSGTFTPTGDMTTARYGYPAATLLPDGKVLIAGGEFFFNGSSAVSSAELYDPSTGTFTATGNMIEAQFSDKATLLTNSKVLLVGFKDDYSLTIAELYDPVTGTFSPTDNIHPGGGSETATLVMNGKVLFVGGVDDNYAAYTGAELYDPAVGAFAVTGDLTTGRVVHTATLLPDGTVLIAGGQFQNSGGAAPPRGNGIASAELYDPLTGRFSPTGSMTQGRNWHTATVLKGGQVLITGGIEIWPGGTLASAELYCPVNVNCPPDPWREAINRMKASAGSNSLSFWQWTWYWQNTPAFSGAPAGFGVAGSISPDVMDQIIAAGSGDPFQNISAEQWVVYFRQMASQ